MDSLRRRVGPPKGYGVLDRSSLAWTRRADPGLMSLPRLGTVREDSESSSVGSHVYRFGQFMVDPRRRTLSCAESPVFLTPKAFDVLMFLVRNPNRLVTKEELLQSVWEDTFVEEGNLAQYICHLRKALGDSEGSRLIVTIARKGYKFTGDVSLVEVRDTAKHATLRVPATETLRADARLVEFPTRDTTPRAPTQWRRAVVVAAATLILLAVGYISWRHFRDMAPPKSGKIIIAVLPFQNLTGDPEREYLADGLTEQMISQLGRLNTQQLGVIARTSVMGYKHKDERLDQIGRDLSVQYVLESSLRSGKDHLRITAQLIQVKDQTHLWSQDYDYSAQDILTVQDDVAKAVAREIELRLSPQQEAELARPRPVNPGAFDAYLQGRYFFVRNGSDEDADKATMYYERATQLDPSYALAWVGLSRARYRQADRARIPAEEGHRLAREAINRALALNPNLAEAQAQMGLLKLIVDLDWAGADAAFQRAVALAPGDSTIALQASFVPAAFGRFEEALELARRAVELDPLNAYSRGNLGQLRFFMGRHDEAVTDLKKAIELNPDVWLCHSLLGEIYVMQGRAQDALVEIGQERAEFLRLQQYAIAYRALGREKESGAALSELIAKYHTSSAFEVAKVYAFRNQPDEAFEWLDRAYAQRDGGLPLTNEEPLLKSLHNDPRYTAFLKKIHLPT